MAGIYDVVEALGTLRAEVNDVASSVRSATAEYERMGRAASEAENRTSGVTGGSSNTGGLGASTGGAGSSGGSMTGGSPIATAISAEIRRIVR